MYTIISVLSGSAQKVNQFSRTLRSVKTEMRSFGVDDESRSRQIKFSLTLRSVEELERISIETGTMGVIFILGQGRVMRD